MPITLRTRMIFKYNHVPSFFRNLTFGYTNFKLQILNANFKLSLFNQWRNVISGVQRSHSRSAKSTSCAPYMHKLSKGSRACSHGKFFNLESLKYHFLKLWGENLHNSDGQKTTLQHMKPPWRMFLLYSLSLGPPFVPLGMGAPGLARSEPIVVTPLHSTLYSIHVHKARVRRKEKIWPASLNFEARTKH